MKAIHTKYLPFTNTKPSRIKASAEGVKSITYTCNQLDIVRAKDGLEHITNHQCAAKLFAHDNHWSTDLSSGGLADGSWVHCFVKQNAARNLLTTDALLAAREALHTKRGTTKTDKAQRAVELINKALAPSNSDTLKVAIVDEEATNGPQVIKRVSTVTEAELYIAELEKTQPEKVHRGGFGIDA